MYDFFKPEPNYVKIIINQIKNLHTQIASILENKQLTFLNLEEQIYHLN